MPKVTKKKITKKAKNDQPATVTVDNTDEPTSQTDKTSTATTKKGIKRKGSSSDEKSAKKVVTNDDIDSAEPTQNVDEDGETIQLPKTMTLKTSTRLSAKGNKSTMKIASWNINGIRAWLNSGGTKYIEQEQPDMICFQELKCDKEKIPAEATPSGYKSYWLSGDTAGYSGVGLLTKIDPLNVKFGIGIAEHDNEGRVITAEYEKFYLVVSYIPNSGRKLVRLDYRQQFNEAFRNYLNGLDKKKPLVW